MYSTSHAPRALRPVLYLPVDRTPAHSLIPFSFDSCNRTHREPSHSHSSNLLLAIELQHHSPALLLSRTQPQHLLQEAVATPTPFRQRSSSPKPPPPSTPLPKPSSRTLSGFSYSSHSRSFYRSHLLLLCRSPQQQQISSFCPSSCADLQQLPSLQFLRHQQPQPSSPLPQALLLLISISLQQTRFSSTSPRNSRYLPFSSRKYQQQNHHPLKPVLNHSPTPPLFSVFFLKLQHNSLTSSNKPKPAHHNISPVTQQLK